MKKWICLLLILWGAAQPLSPALAHGRDGSANYLYDAFEHPVPVPPAYTLSRSLTARDFPEAKGLEKLVDAFVTKNQVLILGAEQLLILDHDLKLQKVISGYLDAEKKEVPLKNCTGLTVGPLGDYYISQSEESRILHFSPEHQLLRVLERPDIPGFEDVKYRPTKLALDQAGRLYVISKGMYEGILELSGDGSFTRFFGVNEVHLTPWQLIWRVFATKEQRQRQMLWLPSDFTNLCMDADGFMFATLLPDRETPRSVKRLNARGENIIKVPKGQPYPMGDEAFNESGFGIPTGPSHFIAVDAHPCGVYICLDAVRSRVFAYNEDHRLLFAFGGPGDREGYFRSPVDACFVGDQILVVDALGQSLELFAPTKYGQALMDAVRYQHLYEYEKAAESWALALTYHHNLPLAYSGIGRTLLRQGRHEEALRYLKLGEDRAYYDKAYEKVRNQAMREAFVPAVCIGAGVIAGALIIRRGRKKKRGIEP